MEVSHFLRNFESSYQESLYRLDEEEAERVQIRGCARCGGKLDRADYWRRPRGLPVGERKVKRRFSFCCRECRHRTTPGSVRFLGRKVYFGISVLLISALRQGRRPKLLRELRALSGASEVTIRRWLSWWQEAVLGSAFWKAERIRFMPLLDDERLACSLYERFSKLTGAVWSGVEAALRFLRPLSIPEHYPC